MQTDEVYKIIASLLKKQLSLLGETLSEIHELTLKFCICNVFYMGRKFCQSGSNFDGFFLVNEGREDPNTTISGPL